MGIGAVWRVKSHPLSHSWIVFVTPELPNGIVMKLESNGQDSSILEMYFKTFMFKACLIRCSLKVNQLCI